MLFLFFVGVISINLISRWPLKSASHPWVTPFPGIALRWAEMLSFRFVSELSWGGIRFSQTCLEGHLKIRKSHTESIVLR